MMKNTCLDAARVKQIEIISKRFEDFNFFMRLLTTKRLTDSEKLMYLRLLAHMHRNRLYFVDMSNAELAEKFGVSVDTITARLASMKKKHFVNLLINHRKNRRLIYLLDPFEVDIYEERISTEEVFRGYQSTLQGSIKKALIVGETNFEALIEKLIESSYLTNVQDCSTQFALTLEQIDFLTRFRYACPNKKIDCQLASYSLSSEDYKKILFEIERSDFLLKSDNLSLKWCLDHAAEIMKSTWITSKFKLISNYNPGTVAKPKPNFTGRTYTREQMNSLFNSIDDIEI